MQVKLTHFVIAGDENGLHDYLQGIVTRFFIETDLPVYLQHVLITDLQIILIRLLEIIKLEDDEYTAYYAQLEKNNNMPVLSQITITLNLFKDICIFTFTCLFLHGLHQFNIDLFHGNSLQECI